MRIGIFTEAYRPYISGVVNSIDMLKKGLEESGHEVFVISLIPIIDPNYIDDSNIIRFKGKSYPFKSLKEYSYTTFLNKKAKELTKYNFDIIHIHTEFSIGKIGIKCARKLDIPIVFTFHTNYEDYFHYISTKFRAITNYVCKKYIKNLINFYGKKANCFIVPTKKVENIFDSYNLNIPVLIIPTGIDINRFKKENVDIHKVNILKEKYNLHNKFVFSFIGRVSPEKSVDSIIKTFSKLKQEDVVLMICGGGTVYNELIDLCVQLKIEDRVIFTGMIEYKDIPLYYQCTDVFVNASYTETQGLTYIESLASSIPILVKKDEALKNLLIENINGFSFENEEGLLYKMNMIIDNKDIILNMKKICENTIFDYRREVYSDAIECIYKEFIK